MKHSVAETDQICIFYGRDVKHSSCQQVVAKQYLGDSINELLREIKVYTELKNQKVAQDPTQKDNFNNNTKHVGLPKLIDYKIKEALGEIIVTNEGLDLDKWGERIPEKNLRRKFMFCMLRDLIQSLQIIHTLGYCHGDLKPENICAR